MLTVNKQDHLISCFLIHYHPDTRNFHVRVIIQGSGLSGCM